MKLLKTYLPTVATVCEFGLLGGYLEAKLISQLM